MIEQHIRNLLSFTIQSMTLFFKRLTAIILTAFVLFLSTTLLAQDAQPPFWNDIQAFKKSDERIAPPHGKILMIGSSSFTFWQDVSKYLPGYPFINRGFGGSSLPHLIRYFDDIVTPYKPRQILIYCGENDLAGNVPADTVVARFKTLFHMLREQNKKAKITYVSMKPSPSRQHLLDMMKEGNEKIKTWLETQRRTSYVDVYSKMVDENGIPNPEIFVKDRLHMNGNGYEIWAKEIQPHLLKN